MSERVFYATTEGGERVEITLSSLMNAKWDSSGLFVRTASSLGAVEVMAESIDDAGTNDLRARIEKLKVGKSALRNERNFLRRKHLEALAESVILRAENDRLCKDEKAVDEIMRRWLKYTGVELCDDTVSLAWQVDNAIVGLRAENDRLRAEINRKGDLIGTYGRADRAKSDEIDRLRAVIDSHAQSGCMCQFCKDARGLAESEKE